MHRVSAPAIVASVVFLTGCDLLDRETGRLEIITDQGIYQLDATIDVSIANNSGFTVYSSSCLPAFIEETNGRTISRSWTLGGFCECICLFELKPGESMIYPISGDQRSGWQPRVGYSYRVRFRFYRDAKFAVTVKPSDLVSNLFHFETPT